jgi:hypothetical protein
LIHFYLFSKYFAILGSLLDCYKHFLKQYFFPLFRFFYLEAAKFAGGQMRVSGYNWHDKFSRKQEQIAKIVTKK